jgi:hypothetical protein
VYLKYLGNKSCEVGFTVRVVNQLNDTLSLQLSTSFEEKKGEGRRERKVGAKVY